MSGVPPVHYNIADAQKLLDSRPLDVVPAAWLSDRLNDAYFSGMNSIKAEELLSMARHPLTCGGNRGDEQHRAFQAAHGGDLGQLLKVENGWWCPVCGWKQDNKLQLVTRAAHDDSDKVKEILAIADHLQEWISQQSDGDELLEPMVAVQFCRSSGYRQIVVGDVAVFDEENDDRDQLSFEYCKEAWLNWLKQYRPFLKAMKDVV